MAAPEEGTAAVPFVGRDRELARAVGLLDGARAGHGRLLLCTGEAGIGKTRLAEETAAVAAEAHAERYAAEQLFPAFREFGLAPDLMETTTYEADEFYLRS